MLDIHSRTKEIKCLITDVDGVLTSGHLYLHADGEETKAFHVQDGQGLKLLMHAGIEVAVITTAVTSIIEHRMKQLGIKLFYKGQRNKTFAYEQIKEALQLDNKHICYIGDDIPDLPCIKTAGFGVAVANAVPMVKKAADWVTSKEGGTGAVRELCDIILESQGLVDKAIERYL